MCDHISLNEVLDHLVGDEAIQVDPWLSNHAHQLRSRHAKIMAAKKEIELTEHCSLETFATAYRFMGIHRVPGAIEYREWAANATKMSLVGDFNSWNIHSHPMTQLPFGSWMIRIPDIEDGVPAIPHGSKVKVCVWAPNSSECFYRIPAWIRRAIPSANSVYDGVFWDPKISERDKVFMTCESPPRPGPMIIYEMHIGVAAPTPSIGSYIDAIVILPYIASQGYTAIQLMAIAEHVYYASFGYQVTSFFAVSSRFGTPEDFKMLVAAAHRIGLIILLDIVHAHASKNTSDGLNHFDGSTHQYFHDGPRGEHKLWDSRLFNYNVWEVRRFLLSNLRYWADVYKVDGFRFDGVTAMIYKDRGLHQNTSSYDDYFNDDIVDEDAIIYLGLASILCNSLKLVTIVEEVRGYPTLALPIKCGGIGFDFRLAMGIPDMWIRLMKQSDEDWSMSEMSKMLLNRRHGEAHIAYAESHDQSLVGDKTISFWLMDSDMYYHMSKRFPLTLRIDRGIALHKIIRLITAVIGGEGYLTFMGNEYGHPEWIDLPRFGNNESMHHAHRRWYLMVDQTLRYRSMAVFESAMLSIIKTILWAEVHVTSTHDERKTITVTRGNTAFAFNFHPNQSYTDVRLYVPSLGTYQLVLDSDDPAFDGHDRHKRDMTYKSSVSGDDWRPFINIYVGSRSAIALREVL